MKKIVKISVASIAYLCVAITSPYHFTKGFITGLKTSIN